MIRNLTFKTPTTIINYWLKFQFSNLINQNFVNQHLLQPYGSCDSAQFIVQNYFASETPKNILKSHLRERVCFEWSWSSWVAIKISCYITGLNLCPHLVSQILGYWNAEKSYEGRGSWGRKLLPQEVESKSCYLCDVTKRRQKMEGGVENGNKWLTSSASKWILYFLLFSHSSNWSYSIITDTTCFVFNISIMTSLA